MPSQRQPGAVCQITRPVLIDAGTMCRSDSPLGLPAGILPDDLWDPASALIRALAKKWKCDDDVRSEIARIALKYQDTLRWREDKGAGVKCSRFVDDVLTEVFAGAMGHGFGPPPRIGGLRGLLAHALEIHRERPLLHDLGTTIRAGRKYPPLARDWAIGWIDIPMWTTVTDGPSAAQPGDIIGEWIVYSDATGHVGIVVSPGKTASADWTATPPGKITIGDYGFRSDQDPRIHGHANKCAIRRFSCPDPSIWHS